MWDLSSPTRDQNHTPCSGRAESNHWPPGKSHKYSPWQFHFTANSQHLRWCCESAALNMPANLGNSAVATGLEKVSFHSNPKERQCHPMGYTVRGILWARILEWVAFPFSRWSSQPRDRTQVCHIAGKFFTSWATREAHFWVSVTYLKRKNYVTWQLKMYTRCLAIRFRVQSYFTISDSGMKRRNQIPQRATTSTKMFD